MEKFLFACARACLLACIVGLRARIAGQNVRVSMAAEQLLTPSQQVTGSIPGNDMLFFFFFFKNLSSAMYTHARQLPVQNTIACTALQDLYEVRP